MCQPRHRGRGELAEWLRSGLQIRVQEFDSPTRLHLISMKIFLLVCLIRSGFFSGLQGSLQQHPISRRIT